MNTQQLLNTLAGMVLTLGSITVTSAGTPPWQYDADSDRITYAFSGPDHKYGDGDYPAKRQAGNLPWRYDADSDTVVRAFNGPDRSSSAQSSEATPFGAVEYDRRWFYKN